MTGVQTCALPILIYHLSVPTYFLFDSIWESRLIKDSSGDPLAIDRSIFSDSSYFRSLNPFLYRHVNIFLYLHSLHEQLRRLVFSWRLKGKAPAQQAEIISAATIRALRYMNHITELEGAKFFAYFHNSNEQIFGGYVPEVLHRNAAIFISALMPESPPIVRIVQKLMETMEFPVRMIQFEHAQDRTIPGEVHLNPVGLAAWEKAIRAKLWESRVLGPFKAPASRGHGQVVK
mgnify:FL=1